MDTQITVNLEEFSRSAFVAVAEMFVGLKESSDEDNSGELIIAFQKAIDGKANREPWCLSFVQFCAQWTCLIVNRLGGPHRILLQLFPTESCIQLWEMTPSSQKLFNPVPGCIAVWQFFDKQGGATRSGHCGVVISVSKETGTFRSVEGNTSFPGKKIDRNGDGVYKKTRNLRSNTGSMRLIGFILPFELVDRIPESSAT